MTGGYGIKKVGSEHPVCNGKKYINIYQCGFMQNKNG